MRSLSLFLLLFLYLSSIAFCQKTILWQVNNSSTGKVSYLLGSYHQMGNSFIDEKPTIQEKLLKSELAIFESVEDIGEKIVGVMLAREDDFSYRTVLDAPDVTFLETYAAGWKVPLSKQKPGELLVKLQQKYVEDNCGVKKPTDSFNHMDQYLLTIARRHNIQVAGLETYADQFSVINNKGGGEFTWEQAKAPVHYWVEALQKHKKDRKACAVATEYMKMKFDYEFDVKCAENDPLLSDRNEKWMQVIAERVSTNNCFITVGMLHLYGNCGIISQLRAKGYEVTPVMLK